MCSTLKPRYLIELVVAERSYVFGMWVENAIHGTCHLCLSIKPSDVSLVFFGSRRETM